MLGEIILQNFDFKNLKSKGEYEKIFSDDKSKVRCFDILASLFYDKNFGTINKSEFDLLMFAFYIEQTIKKYSKESDNYNLIDYNSFSDYKIGVNLGLTPQRVKGFKVRKELIYPQEDFDWKKSFMAMFESEKYEIIDDKLRMIIPDPNVYNALLDFMEDHGRPIDIKLNSKIFEIKIDYLIDFALLFEDEADQKKIREDLIQKFDISDSEKNNSTGKIIFDALGDSTGAIMSYLDSISPVGNVFSTGLELIKIVVNTVDKLKRRGVRK